MLYAEALVRLVVDAGVALPAGVTSTHELLHSAFALAAFQTKHRAADRVQLEAANTAAPTDLSLTNAPVVPAAGAQPLMLRYGFGLGGGA